jgi:site-specific recombinase XerD
MAPLFQNRKGAPLLVRFVQKYIAKYRKAAGLEVNATPHTLRHSHAMALHKSGVPSRVIQHGLGHRRLSTTEVYLGVCPGEMRRGYEVLGG